MSLNDIEDVRQRAAAILSGHKLRQLETAGLAVVEAKRLSALERLYRAHKRMRQSSRDMRMQALYLYAGQAWMQAAEDADKAVMELEEIERG